MTKDDSLLQNIHFPSIKPFRISKDLSDTALISAIGFEERTFGVIDKIISDRKKFGFVLGIDYKPFAQRNKKREFIGKLKKMELSSNNFTFCIFDRENPADIEDEIFSVLEKLKSYNDIWIDISAMSKMAIVIILQGLSSFQNRLHIMYSEAAVYHPTIEEFEEAKKKLLNGKSIEFLSSGVFETCTTISLSTPSMQGYPLLLVASPDFNPNLLSSLKNDLSPNRIILMEGNPHKAKNRIRINFLREINKDFYLTIDDDQIMIASTFNYTEVIEGLEKIYKKFCFTHKIAVSPAASKLQALGVYLFKKMHPDIQIVYPTPKEFYIENYTDGVEAIWKIEFEKFGKFICELDEFRFKNLYILRDVLTRKK